MISFLFILMVIFISLGLLTYRYKTFLPARRVPRPWEYKLSLRNLDWLFYENDDDGTMGPEWYVPPNKVFVFQPFYFLGIRLAYPKFFIIEKNADAKGLIPFVFNRSFLKEHSKSDRWRKLCWWFRNPAHNLTFYVIGVVDQDRFYRCKYASNIHKPGGGMLLATTVLKESKFPLFFLPFVSYVSPWVKCYVGWRPAGAFGLKLNISVSGKIIVH